LVELNELDFCKRLEKLAKAHNVELILPVDVVVASEIKPNADSQIVESENIPVDKMGLDIGPKTSELINQKIAESKTILWNGPLGVFETKGFETGTQELVKELVKATAGGAKTIVGGGDSVAAIQAMKIAPDNFYHVSTGGGATLEFLEGVELPGVACLENAEVISTSSI
jgi:phosphoglycerate kinase